MFGSFVFSVPPSGHFLSSLMMVSFYVLLAMLPAIIALVRRHPQVVPILMLCFVTVFNPTQPHGNYFWILALIWSCLNLSHDVNFFGQKVVKPKKSDNDGAE